MSSSSYDIRSGYFRVTDEDRLKQLVETAGLELFSRGNLFAFGIEGSDSCSINAICIDGENEEAEFSEEVQAILPPGEIRVIQENVHEKVCYINSFGTIITKEEIRVLDFREMLLYEAKQMNHRISNENLDMNY